MQNQLVTDHGNRITSDSELIIYAHPSPEILQSRLKLGIYSFENNQMYKRCSRCREHWPADSEFFYASKAERDGLYPWCKACYIEHRYPNGRK